MISRRVGLKSHQLRVSSANTAFANSDYVLPDLINVGPQETSQPLKQCICPLVIKCLVLMEEPLKRERVYTYRDSVVMCHRLLQVFLIPFRVARHGNECGTILYRHLLHLCLVFSCIGVLVTENVVVGVYNCPLEVFSTFGASNCLCS